MRIKVTTLAADRAMPGRLCLDERFVYWTSYSDGTVHRVPLAGGEPVTLAGGQQGPAACAVAAGRVVWTNFVETGAIMALDLPDRGGDPVVVAEGQHRPNVIVVAGDDVFWVTSHSSDGRVMTMRERRIANGEIRDPAPRVTRSGTCR